MHPRPNSLPYHPSLPVAPHLRNGANHAPAPPVGPSSGHPQAQQQQAYPYPNGYPQFAVSSHYAQAYAQYNQQAGPSYATTPQGYAYSSAYLGAVAPAAAPPVPKVRYPPGSVRCKKEGCTFYGSASTVETHMMDRHLIYPPDWHERKKKPEWDADPSLKGKKIPILGTTVSLDTPEAIEQWIAERKKRFPTTSRVEEKQKNIEEARKRGQLDLGVTRFPKRQRLDGDGDGYKGRGRGRGRDRGRGDRGRGRGRGGMGRGGGHSDHNVAGLTSESTPRSLPQIPAARTSGVKPEVDSEEKPPGIVDHSSDSNSDSEPELLSSKPTEPIIDELATTEVLDSSLTPSSGPPRNPAVQNRPTRKHPPPQPRRPPRNPFAERSSLLRNLLLPEIRMTVSNLSQAIRFLVDNDFLDNVELKPGQANEKMIEVIEPHAVDGRSDSTDPQSATFNQPPSNREASS